MATLAGLASIGDLIECHPDHHEGRPHIAGTGVSVGSIGILWQEGLSPAAIQAEYPGLHLEQIHAAIAFYLHNRAVIDDDLEQQAHDYDQAVEDQRIARLHGDRSLG
jgi:uncharacterized protein (DUF433 family)